MWIKIAMANERRGGIEKIKKADADAEYRKGSEKSNRTRFNPEPNRERIKRIFGNDLVRYKDVYDKLTYVMCMLYEIYNIGGIPNEEHYYELWDALDGLLDSVDSVQQEHPDK